MIIVLEGSDQAGKKTQTKLLANALRTKKKKYKIFNFPDYSTPIGREIKQYLNGKRKFSPAVVHCLLAANRWEKLKEMRDAISKNHILIMNRYYQSNIVYGTMNGLDRRWLENLDAGLPKADLVIVLDVTTQDSFLRKKSGRDRFEKDKEYAKKISQTYRKLTKVYGWKKVQASGSKREIHESIMKIVSKKLLQ